MYSFFLESIKHSIWTKGYGNFKSQKFKFAEDLENEKDPKV